ncbi:MAG: HNH endonuclease [Methanosarcinaceae archaeon]|nr:HNH endonuclease [Methanosarcinaceae archaeon]
MKKSCYLCGSTLLKNINKSKDHVPPDCIFPDTKPKNLITLPCCEDCNKEYGILDEKMKNYISILAGEKSKNEILKSPKLRNDFLKHTQPHSTLIDSSGNPRLLFNFKNEELDRWIVRIVKGLYFNKYKKRMHEHSIYKVKAHPELAPQHSETFPMEEGLNLRPFFVYGFVKDENKENRNTWVLIFYDHLIFTVSVDYPN